MKGRPKSELLYKKLCDVIPGGVNSPVRSCTGVGQLPMVAEYASGDLIYDVDGNEYIDYCGSWGPLIHGHAHPEIIEVAQKQMAMGTTFGITSKVEEAMASKICSLMDSIEKIRFVSSGTEATMSAARLARGYTSKNIIVKFDGNYHGHADFFLVKTGSGVLGLNKSSSSAGIPTEAILNTISLPYNDEKTVKDFLLSSEYKDNIAAVILEPIAANMGVIPASQSFLAMLRETTHAIGALLIFDEVISGFRMGLKGAQGLYHIKPDLTCLGKIIGGGFPAAAFGGRREIMDCLAPLGPVYQAGTLSGNPIAMAAGLKAITLLEKENFYEDLERKTDLLTAPIKEYLRQHPEKKACLQQAGSIFTLFFGKNKVSNMEEALQADGKMFGKFFRYMFANGVYLPPLQWEAWFISSAHKEENLIKTRDLTLNFFNNHL